MDIGIFPQELVEKVANFLSLNDILSCCLVNSSWRRAFNDNRIWFDLCSKRSPVHFDKFCYIEEQCTVVPRFEFLDIKCDTLEQICKWRERFMQEAHLTRNWRHGRHSKHMIIDFLEDDRDDFNFRNIQCAGNFTIVPYSERREFYVYNIYEKPILTQIIKYSLDYMIEDFFKLSNNRLVIVQCTLLQVYELSQEEESVILTHAVLFDSPEQASLNLPKANTSSWYSSNVGLYPCEVSFAGDHNGKYFIGTVYNSYPIKYPNIHIWDIESGKKVGTKCLPFCKQSILDITFSVFKSLVFVLVKFPDADSNGSNSIYQFDFETFEFSPSVVQFNYVVPYILFSDEYILNVDKLCKNIYFWNHKNGKLVNKIPCKNRLNPLTLSVVNNHLLYAENFELTAIVRVIPLSNVRLSAELSVSFNVNNVCMVRDGMILVSVQMGILLFDLASTSILTALEYEDCLWSNASSSKVITLALDGLYLLSFW